MKILTLIISLQLCSGLFAYSLKPAETCTVTYIANEGFLIQTKNSKILTDALFGGIRGNWCDQPGDSVLRVMTNGVAGKNSR